jgi:pimeloyl-ACP methyl ester carboxylesterase
MRIEQELKVIFEPEVLGADYIFKLPENVKEIFIGVEPNVTLNGLLFQKKENSFLMVYFQGNAKNLQNFLDTHHMVLDWGYDVLVTDYRSFGKSTGVLSGETQMYADADKVYDYALQLGYRPENIIFYGYSMGTSLAAYLASTRSAKAVIMESAYSSLPEVAWVGHQTPSFELNSAKKANRINIPALLIHGDQDDVITPDHSERIFANLGVVKKQRIVVENGGHGDLRKRPEYKNYINDFIEGISKG